MDKIEVRNLLFHPKLDPNVLEPLGYHSDTFKVICAIVEEAFDVEQHKSATNLKMAVRKLKKLNGDRSQQ